MIILCIRICIYIYIYAHMFIRTHACVHNMYSCVKLNPGTWNTRFDPLRAVVASAAVTCVAHPLVRIAAAMGASFRIENQRHW